MPADPVEAVRVFVLSCGQANTNWIEYYADKTSKVPTATAIFDLGKSDRSDDGDGQALAWIMKRIAGFYDLTSETTHTIEFVAFSHADQDHWAMCSDFSKAIPDKLKIKINTVYRGGEGWSTASKQVVKDFAKERPGGRRKTPVLIEDYRTDMRSPMACLHAFSARCRCRVVIANSEPVTLVKIGLRPNLTNATSLVLAVEMAGKTVLLTGDATWVTMHGINALYTDGVGPKYCYAMTLPHHGALRTALNPTSKKQTDDKWIIKKFAENVKPKRIVASAGYKSTHQHPQRAVMNLFETGLTTPSKTHKNVVYDEATLENEERTIHSWTTLSGDDSPVTPVSTNTDADLVHTLLEEDTPPVVVKAAGGPDGAGGMLGTDDKPKKKAAPTKRPYVPDVPDVPEEWIEGDPRNDDPDENPRKRQRHKKVVLDNLPKNVRHNNIEYLLTSAGVASMRVFPGGVTDDALGTPVEET